RDRPVEGRSGGAGPRWRGPRGGGLRQRIASGRPETRRHRSGHAAAAGWRRRAAGGEDARLHASRLRPAAGCLRCRGLAAISARGGMMELRLPDPVVMAIPAFIALAVLEVLVARWRRQPAYELRDTAASLTMGLVNLVQG